MGTIGPTTNQSTGKDDHPLAFEVTSAERSRLGRPSSFLNGKERKLSEASSEMPPYLSFQLQIIQNLTSTRKRVPQLRGKIKHPAEACPVTNYGV